MVTAARSAPITAKRLQGLLWSRLRMNLLLCLGVAVFLSVLFRDGFWINLLFSVCIGLSIQTLVESGRYGLARWLIRRGHDSAPLHKGWPGWPLMGPWVLLSALLGYAFGMSLGGWLAGIDVGLFKLANPRAMFLVLAITLVVSLAFTYHFYASGQLASAQAAAEAAQRQSSEHQLMLLQSQLEPHMLFNTLANLRVLIGLDPARAQAMLDHLIAYLRATLSASRMPTHALGAEFDRLADYLALMAVRMGPRLQVVLDLPEALRQLPVPPLLLQPLVENSIQHGLEPQIAGGRITVRAQRQGEQLLLTVRDTGVGLHQTPTAGPAAPARGASGFGTAQVRERLATLYGPQASFTLAAASDAEGGTLASINLPWPGLTPSNQP